MKASSSMSTFFIGLALFSMFFGSGNLIFPLFVGQITQNQWTFATLGFVLTAVALPFMGVIAMVVYRGDYSAFFKCLGKSAGFLMTLILLTVWIPLGSGPRCATLAYASLSQHFPNAMPLWLFSIGYCLLVSLVIYKKHRMLDILGYVLTPLLLISLALVVFVGVDFAIPSGAMQPAEAISLGLKEGYNTMDLIASFFFSASIIDILRKSNPDETTLLKKALKAAAIGVLLLALVYIGLIGLAAAQSENLIGVPKDRLFVYIAHLVLGPQLGIIAALCVFLACFTTSIALVSVYADFLAKTFFGNANQYPIAIIFTQVATFGMSIFGLQGITFITEPILQVFYPFLLVLIVINVGRQLILQKYKKAESVPQES